MTPVAENVLRAVARKCRSEIIKATEGRPKKEHDRIITPPSRQTRQINNRPAA